MLARSGRFMTVSFCLLLAPLAAVGCDGGISAPDGSGRERDVATVSLEPGSAALQVGESVQFRVSGGRGPGPSFALLPSTWSSSDPAVAAVFPGGLVRAVSPGGATITLSGPGGRATAVVTVGR